MTIFFRVFIFSRYSTCIFFVAFNKFTLIKLPLLWAYPHKNKMRFLKKIYRSFKQNSSTVLLVVLCSYYIFRKYLVTNGIEINILGANGIGFSDVNNQQKGENDYDYKYDDNFEDRSLTGGDSEDDVENTGWIYKNFMEMEKNGLKI